MNLIPAWDRELCLKNLKSLWKLQLDREVGYSDFRAVLITIHESCHDSIGILQNKFLKVCKMWIINLIPAWDHEKFVLQIWNPHESLFV